MKKLMTVLASAATALFAIGVAKGDGFVTQGINFEEGYSAGAVFDAQKDDAGGSTGDKFWYSTASAGEIGDISNSTASVATTLVPDFFTSAAIGNYLHIDASAPLFRSAVANDQSGAFTAVDIGDGIYLDTLVQFTAADDAFQTDLDTGDKIAISYVEHEDDDTTADVNEAWTNFVIRAGQIVQGVLVQNNYFAAVPAGFNKEDWHRLTVRTINISATQVGFIIYLDGDMDKVLAYPTTVDAGFGELSGVAAAYYNANLHALYPSAVDNTDGSFNKISAASFSGTGALDDVVFTATKPSFITEQAKVTIAWTEGVATVTIGDAEAIACTGAGSTVVDLPANGTVLVTATFADGYEAGTYTVAPPGAQGSWDSTTGGFINLADGNVCTIVAIQPAFDVAGVHYDKFADALAAAVAAGTSEAPATIKLLADVDSAIELSEGYIVLDLAGKTITDGDGTGYAIINSGAILTIINSTENIGHVVPGEQGAAVGLSNGSTTIEGGSFDGAFEIDAPLVIKAGLFLDEDAAGDAEYFALATYVEQGAQITAIEDNYFQVGEGGEQPTTYSVSFSSGEGYTVTDITNVTDGKAEAGATVTFKVTVASGFDATTLVVKNGETVLEADEGVYSVTVNAAVAITITVEEEQSATLTLTITPNENADATVTINEVAAATGAEIKAGDVIVVTATPKENFEYAQAPEGWEAGQAGAITKTITVADASVTVEIPAPTAKQQGGYPTYIDTTDADAKAKYDDWKATYGDDTESAYEDAFLLNCAPANVNTEKAAFKFTKIAFENGVWVTETTTKNTNGADYNGEVVVTRYSDVGCTTKSEDGSFFKAELK